MQVLAAYQSPYNIDDVLNTTPEDVFMLRGLISSLRASEGKKVMLVMGFCKMSGRNVSFSTDDMPKTEAITC